MISINKFNYKLNRKNNYFFKNENYAIVFDTKIITRCEDIRYNERKNAH